MDPQQSLESELELTEDEMKDFEQIKKVIVFLTENFQQPQYTEVMTKVCALLLSYEIIRNEKPKDQVFYEHSLNIRAMIESIYKHREKFSFFKAPLPVTPPTKTPPPAGVAVTEPNTPDSSEEEWYEPESFSDSSAYEPPFQFSPGD